MNTLELILPTLISTVFSTGLITAFLSHSYDKKLRTHDVKIQKYMWLIKELAKFTANQPEWDGLRRSLNEALLFASDKVVGEILEFNKKFTRGRNAAEGNDFSMTAADIQPLIVAIRKDLYLKSKTINAKGGLTFFRKP